MPDPGLWLAVCGGSGMLGLFTTIRYWLRLRFLRHVYDRGGAPDLRVAGSALHATARRPCRRSPR